MNAVCRCKERFRCRRRGASRQDRKAYVSPYKIRNSLNIEAALTMRGLALNAKLTLESNTLKYNGNEIQNRIGVCTFATGMANSDCGKFDFNFKSEKFASFEGAGLDSSWNLTIGEADGLSSIDDVILYISFTAKNS